MSERTPEAAEAPVSVVDATVEDEVVVEDPSPVAHDPAEPAAHASADGIIDPEPDAAPAVDPHPELAAE